MILSRGDCIETTGPMRFRLDNQGSMPAQFDALSLSCGHLSELLHSHRCCKHALGSEWPSASSASVLPMGQWVRVGGCALLCGVMELASDVWMWI